MDLRLRNPNLSTSLWWHPWPWITCPKCIAPARTSLQESPRCMEMVIRLTWELLKPIIYSRFLLAHLFFLTNLHIWIWLHLYSRMMIDFFWLSTVHITFLPVKVCALSGGNVLWPTTGYTNPRKYAIFSKSFLPKVGLYELKAYLQTYFSKSLHVCKIASHH